MNFILNSLDNLFSVLKNTDINQRILKTLILGNQGMNIVFFSSFLKYTDAYYKYNMYYNNMNDNHININKYIHV